MEATKRLGARSITLFQLGRTSGRGSTLRRAVAASTCMDSLQGHELAKWRSGFTPWEQGGWIHMNAAGASPMAEEVHAAMLAHFDLERQKGGYEAAKSCTDVRAVAADLLGCAAEEIALTESAQSAWARAFYSLQFRDGDRIFCWTSEYAGNAVAFLQAARQNQVKLEILPMRRDGLVDVDALRNALASMPKTSRALVALTHIQTNSSIVQPAELVGSIAREHGAVFLLDACQSIGQVPVNVRALNCDFACGTGRKWLRGPRGTGVLYARASALPQSAASAFEFIGEPPMIDHVSVQWTSRHTYRLRSDAGRYEMWEFSPALREGLGAALKVCLDIGPQRISDRANYLANRLRTQLAAINGLHLCDAPEPFERTTLHGVSQCAIVCFEMFSSHGIAADFIKEALAGHRIAVSVSPPSHTFNDGDWNRPSTVRLSPSYYNEETEIEIVVQKIREIIEGQIGRRPS
mmetsp:Transcript_52423/g.122309  ORF Transcript_52423/g.122309 Transcript_52423/m.122309 type:complete len:464 (+) Transcript_52423:183-1574(+)